MPNAESSSPVIEQKAHLMSDKYILDHDSVLGKGSSSIVKLGHTKVDNLQVAIKILKSNEDDTEKQRDKHKAILRNEYEILRSLEYPNIVKAYDLYEEEGNNFSFILEYLAGGELFDRIISKKHYSEKDARDIAQVILSTIKYMHGQGIVHRDLKPENLIFCNDDEVSPLKLADFGLAAKVDGLNLTGKCGTVQFMAPEIIKKELNGKPVDMWAFGVILYILLAGYAPFQSSSREETFRRILQRDLKFHEHHWKTISDEVKDLISKILVEDQTERYTVEDALSHSWLKQTSEVLSRSNLDASLEELKTFQARRQFRVAGDAVLAITRMQSMSFKKKNSLGSIVDSMSSNNSRTPSMQSISQTTDTETTVTSQISSLSVGDVEE